VPTDFNKKQYLETLRLRAEQILPTESDSDKLKKLDDISNIIQDLNIYHIELEMQNDELFKAEAEAKQARDKYFDLYHYAPVGYATIDKHGRILQANRRMEELFQQDITKIVGHFIFDQAHEESSSELRGRFRAFFNKPDGKEIHFKINSDDCETYVSMTGGITLPTDSASNQDRNLLIAITDITKTKKNELELALSAKVFDSSIEGIVITDKDGKILRVNPAFSIITGYEENEVLGKTPAILKSGQHDKSFYANMWNEISKNGCWHGEIVNRRKNGETYVEWLNISSVTTANSGQDHYIAIFSDITKTKLNSQRMQQLAYYDVLTGLPNRTLFYDRLKQAMMHAKRSRCSLALLFLDLDNFKELNDHHGHAEGDALLQQVANRLQGAVRSSDTVSRISGDEFTIILSDLQDPGLASLEASKIAEKALTTLSSEPFKLNDITYRLSASIGITIYPQDGEVISELIKHADTAMYQAKSAGKNTFHFFSKSMFENLQKKSKMKEDLHKAIEEKQFVLHYQPQVSLETNQIIGHEALIRWNHPEKNLMAPCLFIPTAEEVGLINEIGEWVLEESLSQLQQWHQNGNNNLRISVNLSAEQIHNKNITTTLRKLLDKYDIPANKLEIEITETAILKDTTETSEILRAIKDMGIRISLDDFGTGYSSMTHVKHFPIDSLKIDRTFMGELFDCIEDRSIVMASLSLANNLGVDTIAEGVENQDQLDFLISAGCTHAQGFLISKPLPASEIKLPQNGINPTDRFRPTQK